MLEEFHGINHGDGTYTFKLLYGWNSLNSNAWLPSLIELAGIDPNNYADWSGCYYAAMQGLNASRSYWTDAQGGTQFAYFKPYNTSGGGERMWQICNREAVWLRSSCYWGATNAWMVTSANQVDTPAAAYSSAVHPAVADKLRIYPCI